jgi:translation initiation factor 2 subunit 1
MTTSTPEKQDGLKALTQAIDKIEDIITSMGGVFAIQMAVSRTYISLVGQVC